MLDCALEKKVFRLCNFDLDHLSYILVQALFHNIDMVRSSQAQLSPNGSHIFSCYFSRMLNSSINFAQDTPQSIPLLVRLRIHMVKDIPFDPSHADRQKHSSNPLKSKLSPKKNTGEAGRNPKQDTVFSKRGKTTLRV